VQAALAATTEKVRAGDRISVYALSHMLSRDTDEIHNLFSTDEGRALFRPEGDDGYRRRHADDVARAFRVVGDFQLKLSRTLSAPVWTALTLQLLVPTAIGSAARAWSATVFVDKVEWGGRHYFTISTAGPVAELITLADFTLWPISALSNWQPTSPRRAVGGQPPVAYTYASRDAQSTAAALTELCRRWTADPEDVRLSFTWSPITLGFRAHAETLRGYWKVGHIRSPALSHCGKCGNALTTLESNLRGYGPTCWLRMHGFDEAYATVSESIWHGSTSTPIWSKKRGPELAALTEMGSSTRLVSIQAV